MAMEMVSKSQFKAQLLAYLRKIEQEKKPLLITHGGKPVIKVSPYQEEPEYAGSEREITINNGHR